VPRLLLQGVEIGIGVGIGVSLALVLFKSTFPSIVVLGRLPGTEIYR
jgi:MFS superfamily sulfate permease-like transporter